MPDANGYVPTPASSFVSVEIAAGEVAFQTRQFLNTLKIDGDANHHPRATLSQTPDGMSTLVVNSLDIAHDGNGNYFGTLDLVNNGLVINHSGASPITDMYNSIVSAYNSGDWGGYGLMSSLVKNNPYQSLAVGYGENNDPKTAVRFGDGIGNDSVLFHGVAPHARAVLARFTWLDDLELAGLASSTSAIVFGTNYDNGGSGGHNFAQGDISYDGVIDSTDAILFNTAWWQAGYSAEFFGVPPAAATAVQLVGNTSGVTADGDVVSVDYSQAVANPRITFKISATDPDPAAQLSIHWPDPDHPPAGASLMDNGDGTATITWTASEANDVASDSYWQDFQVVIDDLTNGTSTGHTYSVATHGSSGHLPSAIDFPPINIQQGDPNPTVNLWNYFEDQNFDASQLTFSVASNDNSALVTAATINQATGVLTLSLAPSAYGTANLTVTATNPDGFTTTSGLITVGATHVNQKPVLDVQPIPPSGGLLSLDDDGNLVFDAGQTGVDHSSQTVVFTVAANPVDAYDPEGAVDDQTNNDGKLTFTLIDPPEGTSASINQIDNTHAQISLTVDSGFYSDGMYYISPQTYNLRVRVTDGGATPLVDDCIYRLDVGSSDPNSLHDGYGGLAPIAQSDSLFANVGDEVSGNVLSNDFHAASVVWGAVAPALEGLVTLNTDGTFQLAHMISGTFVIAYEAVAANGQTTSAANLTLSSAKTLAITNPSDEMIIGLGAITNNVIGTATAEDSADPKAVITFSLAAGPANDDLQIDYLTGDIMLKKSAADITGSVHFTVVATDPHGTTSKDFVAFRRWTIGLSGDTQMVRGSDDTVVLIFTRFGSLDYALDVQFDVTWGSATAQDIVDNAGKAALNLSGTGLNHDFVTIPANSSRLTVTSRLRCIATRAHNVTHTVVRLQLRAGDRFRNLVASLFPGRFLEFAAVADDDADLDRLFVAEHQERDFRPDFGQAHHVHQVIVVLHAEVVELENHVVGLQLGRFGGRFRRDARHAGAARVRHAELDRNRGIEVAVQAHAEIRADDRAALDQLRRDIHGHVDRDREADSFAAAGTAGDRRVDADDLALEVHERAAAVAGIDGRVGLQEVLKADAVVAQFEIAAAFRADDAIGDRMAQAEGAAHRQDEIADVDLVAVADAGGDEAVARHGHDGDVSFRIGPGFRRIDLLAVGEFDFDVGVFRRLHDVPIGEDVILVLVLEDDARAGFLDLPLASAAELGRLGFFGFDMHDRRPHQLHALFEDVRVLLPKGVLAGERLELRIAFGRREFVVGRFGRGALGGGADAQGQQQPAQHHNPPLELSRYHNFSHEFLPHESPASPVGIDWLNQPEFTSRVL